MQACEAIRVDLQKVLINRFCIFNQSKTVNCHMQVRVGARRQGAEIDPGID
jgi:hypothetical protein